MTFVAILLPFLALVAAGSAAADGPNSFPNQCGTSTLGSTTGFPQTLSDVTLAPGTKEFALAVPYQPCQNGAHPNHVGTTVTACDNDAAPTVQVTDLYHAVVLRNGYYVAEQGIVHTTVYCI